jgi:hypothetical protein
LLCPEAANESPAKPNGYGGAKAAKGTQVIPTNALSSRS